MLLKFKVRRLMKGKYSIFNPPAVDISKYRLGEALQTNIWKLEL